MTRAIPRHRLNILGTFRIERDSHTLHLPTRKAQSLLAYLALFPEQHPREKLATLLWGDSTDEQARLSLRVALSSLRKELGDDILLADRETIQLSPDYPIWVDAQEFQKSARDVPASAIEWYQGDLLPDFYDDWVAPERERLRSIYLDALLRLVQQARSESKYARAVELAQQILATDRANEKAHQHLIFCYIASGNRAAALKQYDDCVSAVRDELGVAPSAETTALFVRAQAETTAAKSPEASFTNLPIPLTSFIGREREIRELKELLPTTRLLTCTGAGGCGKTRLAIQVATELAAEDRFKHGVWWVDLAPLNDPALVTSSLARVFNLRESSTMPILAVLTNYLRAKQMLLVLDNCEHLRGACAQLANALLSACPQLQILATSRESLNIGGETVWRVPSLALPDLVQLPPLTQLRQYDAIQLFAERASSVVTNWQLAENAISTTQICARLDGIPLAIELATARLRALSLEQITARLDDRFNLLTGGSRIALPRQQTLRATMDWSYDLLTEAERALLRRLSVFAGGFSLEAVEAVCTQKDEGEMNARYPFGLVDLLASLIDKSLVVVEQHGSAMRYRMLETVRQYAHEKLRGANEVETYGARHRDWFLRLVEQADPKLRGPEQMEWFGMLEREMENLRAALAWSLGQADDENIGQAMRLAGTLVWFWIMRGHFNEGRNWLERSLDHRVITPARAKVLLGLGITEYFVGTPKKCHALCSEALMLYRQQEDAWGIALSAIYCGTQEDDPAMARALFEEGRLIAKELKDEWLAAGTDIMEGGYLRRRGDFARARTFYESTLDHARRSGDHWMIGNALHGLANVAIEQGDDQADLLFTEGLALHREMGDKHQIANNLFGLGMIAERRHDDERASTLYKQALALRREIGDTYDVVKCIWALGGVAATDQQYERAARLLGSVESLREALQAGFQRDYAQDVQRVRAQLGDAVFEKARAEGRAMTLDQAAEYALEDVKTNS